MPKTLFRTSLMASTIFAGASFLATPAFAQDGNADAASTNVQMAPAEALDPQPTDAGDEIVVTGTLIRNPNIEASSPVTVVGEEEIELQQSNVAEELLRELPGVVPSIGSAVNNGNGGSSYVNLRGLGSTRNLVLLDGTRITPADLFGRVDLNNIPLALVERVDVLTGGASTTYGADAVAGVVNFITKNDFAGVELEVSEQITEQGDGNIFRADLTIGANFDDGRGNATLSVGYQEADPVYQGAREISRVGISSSSGNPQGSFTTTPAIFGPFPEFDPADQFLQVGDGPTGFTNDLQTFNFNPFNVFQVPFERFNIFASANYEVTDGLQVYSRGLFSKNTVETIIAPSGTFGNGFTFGLGNPFITAAQRATLCAGFGFTGDGECAAAGATVDPNDPAYREVTLGVYRRFVEGGPRTTSYTSTVFDYKVGVRGDITDSIGFDIFGSYGESNNTSRSSGQGLLSRLTQAVDAIRDPVTGEIVCRDTTGGCVPINLFGGNGSIAPGAFTFINVNTTGSTQASLAQVRGVVSGDFGFGSPFAEEPLGFAVGVEYRDTAAESASDAPTQTPGEVLGSGGAAPDIRGSYDVREAFAELVLPLASDRPFFHSLTLELGGRVSDYSTSGTSYTYKIGGSWEPVSSLKIRGNYNRAARSPNISELFFPVSTGLTNLTVDPCQAIINDKPNPALNNPNFRAICVAQLQPGTNPNVVNAIPQPSAAQANFTSGGNPNLDVEIATTWTVGAVFQPDFVPGFTVTVDYYDIEIKDAIGTPTLQDALTACFGSNLNNPAPGAAATDACRNIQRNPLNGGLSGSPATTPGILLASSNLGRIETNGIDVTASYRHDFGPVGLNLSFQGNWTDSNVFTAQEGSDPIECVGFYSVSCASPLPEFSFSQRTTLSFGDTDVSLLWRYIDDLEYGPNDGSFQEEFESIDSYHYFDLSLRQEIMDNFTFTATVQNLFDKKPPLVGNTIGSTAFNSGNTYPSTYDALGRRFAIGANIRF
jgi:outer membrane receptor protein involved in Fe transport